MNHLAHLLLAPPRPLWRLGALLGDFAQGCALDRLPAEVQAGIEHHRAIDAFTDDHPVFRRSRARVSAPLRRCSGVLVDVFYDHFLARDWHLHGDRRPLPEFTSAMHTLLLEHEPLLPTRLRSALPQMIANDWLAACRTTAGVGRALHRLQTRMRRPLPLADGVVDLTASYAALGADFAEFLPAVRAFSAGFVAAGDDAS